MPAVWKTRKVSTVHTVTTETYNNFDFKNSYVLNIPNSFT
jgi:hypothetical protein